VIRNIKPLTTNSLDYANPHQGHTKPLTTNSLDYANLHQGHTKPLTFDHELRGFGCSLTTNSRASGQAFDYELRGTRIRRIAQDKPLTTKQSILLLFVLLHTEIRVML
jgi:hypothetical protein